MAAPNSRSTLIDYAKRKLGFPVIEINVEESQEEDRLDEALQFFFEYHFDGVEEETFIYELTDADVTNGYITIADNFFSITAVSPISFFDSVTGESLFNAPYQLHMTDFLSTGGFFSGGGLSYFDQIRSYSTLLNQFYRPDKNFNFNRKTNKLFLEQSIASVKIETPQLIIKAYVRLDVSYTEIYDDMFLKKYVTALIKKQWGTNLSKFSGVTLPGGTSLNGSKILSEAETEVEALEFECKNSLQIPPKFFVG